jgi:NADPH:quinone reductase-like Zn-dependent oxidoreductase
MKAARVHKLGGTDAIVLDDIPIPVCASDQVLIAVKASGVGNWDALAREGKIPQPLPLTLGAEFSGVVEEIGTDTFGFAPGDEVFGLTNQLFTGGYAQHAAVHAATIATKPRTLTFIEAASVPVVAVTAHKMLFEHGHVSAGQVVLVHGGAGNVGAYLVQFAHRAGARVIATAGRRDVDYVRTLGADDVIDRSRRFEDMVSGVDAVMDTVGGDVQERSLKILKPGGVLVSSVAPPDATRAAGYGVRTGYFIVSVSGDDLKHIAAMLDARILTTQVGTVLPLVEARNAHEMLAGSVPHPRGKIVLQP